MAAAGRLPETCRALEPGGPPLSRSGVSPEAFRAAVHVIDTSDSFAEALRRSIEFAGPANYRPVLVGSIGGARWGGAPITAAMIEHHGDLVTRIHRTADRLADGW